MIILSFYSINIFELFIIILLLLLLLFIIIILLSSPDSRAQHCNYFTLLAEVNVIYPLSEACGFFALVCLADSKYFDISRLLIFYNCS